MSKDLGYTEDGRKILAQYDGNSPANRRFREALAQAPDDTKLANLGLLTIALSEADDRYIAKLKGGDILGAQVEDALRFLIRNTIKEVDPLSSL